MRLLYFLPFRKFAFATHPDAYIKAGITNLPLTDLILITSTPDLAEWWEEDTRVQAIIVAKKMAEEKLKQIKEQLKKIF
jgi:long-subunit acyl-CoA synthetase (AMP-forming)